MYIHKSPPTIFSCIKFINAWRISIFFFFQAEDGIRDPLVTGVQTCALPISWPHPRRLPALKPHLVSRFADVLPRPSHRLSCVRIAVAVVVELAALHDAEGHRRSEERRVGKECRSRW